MIDFLPLGSIVKMKTKDKEDLRMVIVGRGVQANGIAYQYAGVRYPYGLVGEKSAIFFDENAIEDIIFEGYVDEIELEFGDILVDAYNKFTKN